MNKKLLLVALLSTTMLVGCTGGDDPKDVPPEPVKVTSVDIKEADFTLKVGNTQQLTIEVLPENAADKSVSWSSSAATTASVTNGLVKGEKAGAATITVTTTSESKTDTVNVEVRDDCKKSVIAATYNEIFDILFVAEEESDYANEERWDAEDSAYRFINWYGSISSGDTLKSSLEYAHNKFKNLYTVNVEPEAFVWDEGDDGYWSNYSIGNGCELTLADWIEEGEIYLQVSVGLGEYYDLVDDMQSEEKTYTIDFTKLNFTGNLYDENPAKQLTEYVNKEAGAEILSSIEGPASQIMNIGATSMHEARKYITIGSGSSDGYVKFHFLGKIESVTVTAQAYNKYIDYSSSWSIDANAQCFCNSDTNNLGITVKENAEPDVVSATFTFDSAINYLNFYNKAAKERVFILGLTITLA